MTSQKGIVSGKSIYNKIIGGVVVFGIGLYVINQSSQNASFGWVLILAGAAIALTAWRSVPNPRLLMRYHNNPSRTVEELISEWKPEQLRLEHEYEKSLQGFLKTKLPFTKITRQYGSGRVKCDIAVGTEVFIELKRGLKTTNKLQRLIGQVELYRNEWENGTVMILLIGESEDDLLRDLHRSTAKYDRVRVVTKAVASPVVESEGTQQAAISAQN